MEKLLSTNKKNRQINSLLKVGLCCGCGTCQSVCPKKAIHLIEKNGIYLPEINENCNHCNLCAKVCPNININYDSVKQPLKVFNAYSSDELVRNKAASGGFISQLLINGFKNNLFKGAVVCIEDTPMHYIPVLINSEIQVLDAAGSIYNPVTHNVIIDEIIKNNNLADIAVVGLPCHIRGFKRYEKINPNLKKKIICYISLLCGQGPNRNANRYFLNLLNIKYDSVLSFKYRCGGWPGNFKITTEGKEYTYPYKGKYAIGGVFTSAVFVPLHCSLCEDHFGDEADITACDAWKDWQPGMQHGISSVIIWSNKGQNVFNECHKDIELGEISFNDILAKQGHLTNNATKSALVKYISKEHQSIKVLSEYKTKAKDTIKGVLFLYINNILKNINYIYFNRHIVIFSRLFKRLLYSTNKEKLKN